MDIYLICLLLVTAFIALIGILSILFLFSARRTMENLNKTLKEIQNTALSTEKTAAEAEKTFRLINEKLPAVLEDVGQITGQAREISENTGIRIMKSLEDENNTPVPTISAVSSFGNLFFRGYSLWRRLRRNRF